MAARSKYRHRSVISPGGSSRCLKCNLVKPIEAFRLRFVKRENGYVPCSWCKECIKESARSYNRTPQGKIANRARVKRAMQTPEYREKHLEHCRKHNNSPSRKAYMKLYVETYLQKPEVKIKARLRFHARRKVYLVGDLKAAEWNAILAAWGYRCAYCGLAESEAGGLTMDHVLAISRGGHHTFENTVPACKSCNCRKNNISLPKALKRMGIGPASWQKKWKETSHRVREILQNHMEVL